MNPIIKFSPDGASSATGWFNFHPLQKMGWTFEETVARCIAAAPDQDVLDTDDGKSVFDISGFIVGDTFNSPFSICDWREDGMIHVFFPPDARPKGLQQAQFVVALQNALSKVQPVEFRTTYPESSDIFSYPPSPKKEDAVVLALDALNDVLHKGYRHSWKRIEEKAAKAHDALTRAF